MHAEDLSNLFFGSHRSSVKSIHLLSSFVKKKIIKTLADLVPSDQGSSNLETSTPSPTTSVSQSPTKGQQQQRGRTAEIRSTDFLRKTTTTSDSPERHQRSNATIRKSPGEVQFFKLLHNEFQKAVHFVDRVIEEFSIREERVLEGMQIAKQQRRFQLWHVLVKSVYRLYTDLLLLETFCIMTYCSFSKILKKHDKVTGFETRNAFMSNIVNKANFTNYTYLQEMIGRCEQSYAEVSARIAQEGQQELYEDERLFIEMIHQLNQQV
jgi:hypothetical protein